MQDRNLQITDPLEAVLGEVRRRLEAGRAGNFVAELGGPELGFVLYWGRLQEESPRRPRPTSATAWTRSGPSGVCSAGAVTWEMVPAGRPDLVAWNVAEAIDRTTSCRPARWSWSARNWTGRARPSSGPSSSAGAGGAAAREAACAASPATAPAPATPCSRWPGAGRRGRRRRAPERRRQRRRGPGRRSGVPERPVGHDIYVRLYDEGGAKFLAVHPPRMP